uniref:Secreted protein n=1 Tax=Ascaris lumbricoides TaxID=6252 RepID=A0A0M3IB62_ASCLU
MSISLPSLIVCIFTMNASLLLATDNSCIPTVLSMTASVNRRLDSTEASTP